MTEDEMVGWHHRLNGHEFEETLGDGEGQGRLAHCSPWGCKELNTTEQLNNNNKSIVIKTVPYYQKNNCILLNICGIQKNYIDDLICKTEVETEMQRTKK